MKKPADKNKERGKDNYTVTEVGTLIEEFRGEFKVFGEKLQVNTEKTDATFEQVGRQTEEITLLKVLVQKNTEDISSLKTDVSSLKIAIKDIASKIDRLVESIENLIKTKVDREEFQVLEKRISTLEAKMASLAH